MHKGYLAVILLALLGIALAAILTDRGLAVFTDQAPVTANTFTTGSFPTPTTNSFGAVADTYVKEEKGGDDNFGTDTDMQVKSDTSKVKRALVAFDVSSIPAGSTVSSATLTLCLSVDPPVAAQGRTHELRLVTSSWTETVVVWNDQPTVSAAVTDTTTVPTTAQCLIFSVTADVQRWVAGVANNGWRLGDETEGASSGDADYRTRENATAGERPKLDVTYQPCPDTTAPGAPNGLVATASEADKITLDWNDNGESDLAGYNIYRSTTSGGPYTKLNSSLLTSSAYTDAGVTGGITYYYVVTAVDDCANESANSSEDSALADTLDPPTNVSASPILEMGVTDLSWTVTVDAYADGYRILRSTTNGGPYTQIAQVTPQSTTTYQDTGLACATTYYYVVRAYWDATESADSNEANSTDGCTSFGAVGDTYLKEDKGGDDNFGTANDIQVTSESGKLKRSLVSFDVSSIPSGSTINSATLILCLSADPQSGAQGRTHELRLVTSSWIETTVVWNDQPTVSGTATATITVPTTAQCLTFSVTADVQSWVDGTSNYGWRLSDQTEGVSNGDVDYRSRENATTDERPELKVTYTPP